MSPQTHASTSRHSDVDHQTNACCLHLLPADTATVQYAKEYFYEVEKTPKEVPVGGAMVYDGTFTVSGTHANKWKEGRFQYSWVVETENKPLSETLDYPRLGNDVYKLEFVGGSRGHY